MIIIFFYYWLFPLSAREVSPGNRSNYKSTRERVDSKGLYGEMEAPFDRLLAIFILKTHYPSGRTWAETFVVRLVMRLKY